MVAESLDAFIARMPKAELHIHLEGSVRPATLLALAQRNGIALPATNEAELRDFYRFRDFDHFLTVYDLICTCIRTPDDLTLMTYELGAAAATQNIRYLEVTFTTCGRLRRGLPLDDQLAGIRAGAQQAADEFGVRMQFIPDVVAENTVEEAWTLARWAVAQQGNGICALGLAGKEVGRNAATLAPVFTYARDAGLPRTLHAGETVGPESIWDALTTLHADRIGHGVRVVEDPKLLELLYAMQVPLEVCPTSNVRLGLYPDIATHPVGILWRAGLFLTINTDDPPMFDTTLADEYRALVAAHGFTADEITDLSLNAVRAAFLPATEKEAMLDEFEAEMGEGI
ncbi:MAG TPA: adenosine deaminase [Thermomicrobiales bacterium]